MAATHSENGALYASHSGTSMSTPIVSGVVSLLLSVDRSLQPDEIESIIQQTARDVGEAGWDSATGFGIVDAGAAVTAVVGTLPEPIETPTTTPTAIKTPIQTQPTPVQTPTARPPAPAVESAVDLYIPFRG